MRQLIITFLLMLMASFSFGQQSMPFTENFETDLSNWTTTGDTTAIISTDIVYEGTKALDFNTSAGDTASIIVEMSPGDSIRVDFWYYINGYFANNLSVDIYCDGSWKNTIWEFNSTKDDQWLQKSLDLSNYNTSGGNFKLRFNADNHYTNDYYQVYLDNVIIQEKPPNFPYNPSPANIASNTPVSGTLNWKWGSNTEHYDLWFGKDGNMTKVIDSAVATGDEGSYSYSSLAYATKYQWKIVAHNSSPATSEGPTWGFTTPFSSDTGKGTKINPYKISSLQDLRTLSQDSAFWKFHYIQTTDIDASATSSWNSGKGFAVIAPNSDIIDDFTGSYNGQNYSISNLYIDRTNSYFAGLFGSVSGTVENLNLDSVDISQGDWGTGAIAGCVTGTGVIDSCSSSGTISSSEDYTGGLVGLLELSGTIMNSHSSCAVTSSYHDVGGLVGASYHYSEIIACYSTGDVTGVGSVGGFIGYNTGSNGVSNCYSTGNVTANAGKDKVGGFCGITGESIKYCYSTGNVEYKDGTSPSGKGFVGYDFNTPGYTGNFFDSIVSNQNQDVLGSATAKTTAKMQTDTTFTNAGWDFAGESANGDYDFWSITTGYPEFVNGYIPVGIPEVITQTTTNIEDSSAVGNGYIIDLGYPEITQHGVCWDTTSMPTISDNKTEEGAVSSTGNFSSNITGLSPNTTYYVRAYATNSEGTAYGSDTSFTTQKILTIDGSFAASNKTYDGSSDATISSNTLSLSGVVGSDDVNLSNVVVKFASADVADGITVNISNADLTGADANKYTLSLSGAPTTTANITEAELTVSGANAENKVYDGTTDATITGATLNGVISGDAVNISDSSGIFAQSAIGTSISVTPTIGLGGADAANYTVTQPSGLTADITAKELTVSGANAENKVYNGTTDATITSASLNGVVSGDDVSLDNAGSGTFAQAEAGTGISVSTSMSISGADAGNYILTQPSGLIADITAKELTITGASAENKVYEGTTDATITGATLNGVVSGDDVSLDNADSGTFAQAEIGTGITVSTSMSLTGADKNNYGLTEPDNLTADITAQELSISGSFAVADKEYDNTTDATITNNQLALEGIIGEEDVSLDTVGAEFASAEVGSNITVNITYAKLNGADAHNYTLSLNGAPTTTAAILSITTSISEIHSSGINVYPNPTSGVINTETGSTSAEIEVIDMTGSVILSKQQQGQPVEIDLSQQPAGIYYLRILNGEHVSVQKVVKQ